MEPEGFADQLEWSEAQKGSVNTDWGIRLLARTRLHRPPMDLGKFKDDLFTSQSRGKVCRDEKLANPTTAFRG